MSLLRKFFLLLLLPVLQSHAQQGRIVQRIFLVGDAGEMQNGKHPVCDWLKQNVDWNDSSNILVYLGDNIYPNGMPDAGKEYERAKAIIDYQLSVVKDKKAKAFVVPGNHDWKEGRPGGWEQIKNEEYYINSLEWPNVKAFPMNGCPGPVDVQVGDKVVLVFMDSQWWLQKGERPGVESDCDFKTEEDVINALKDILGTYPDKLIVTLMHHPVYTHGPHGGYFTLKQHIFPLTDISPGLYIPMPVIGSIYPISRAWFGSVQDIKHPQYKDFIAKLEEALQQHPNVVDASGHDHTLQLLQHDSVTYIVSGSGSKTTRVKKGKYSLFAKNERGFAVLEVSDDGKVEVKFYTVSSVDLSKPIYSLALKTLPQPRPIVTNVEKEKISLPDSMTIIGSDKLKAGGLKKMFLGNNYRQEWGQPIKVPVIDLSKESGGLTPIKRGGGHETKSLHLEDANGRQYVLRAVTKNVTDAALPPDLRGVGLAKDVISDGVSASYPYACLSVPVFAEAAGVPHANPRLVYIGDDPQLGKFRKDFANRAYFLEERKPEGFKKTYNTDEMAEQLRKDNDNSVDQKQFLNARLLDMFFMDFDRHEGQWSWADEEEGSRRKFIAIPKDRDQPFFISQGLLASIARQNWLAPQIQGFRAHAKNINTYNFNAKNVDHTYLNALDKEDWKKAIDEFLPKMTDDVIEKALDEQPEGIKKLSAKNEIVAKLKERKKYFTAEMMTYYHFLSKVVSIAGSDKREQFEITRNDDGSVLVVVRKVNKDGEVKHKMYERKFDPSETKEIRLYGLDGDDKFTVNGNSGKIKIRIIGGGGDDVYENNSSSRAGKNIVYDLSTENNEFSGKNSFRKKLSEKSSVNNYEWKNFKYNTHRPFISVNYNADDGVYLGASMRFTRQGFRKSPYAQVHQFSVNHSVSTKAFVFKYNGEFVNAVGKADLLLHATVKAPSNTTNFFSYGNETIFDKSHPEKVKYYRARFQTGDFGISLRHKFGTSVSLTWGPLFEYYNFDSADNKDRYILMAPANGLNPATLEKSKTWAGAQFTLGIDDRNNKLMPTRGINWQTTFRMLGGLNNYSNTLSQLNSDLSLYMSFSRKAGFVLATRFGGGINFNDDFEFFQAQYLGGTENLRGFRKYRFAGRSMAYNNVEMRIRIADFRTYLFPGTLGILIFNDVGRVWIKNDSSSIWHDGYGAGIWFSPLQRLAITASVTTSNEETLPLVTFGWQF